MASHTFAVQTSKQLRAFALDTARTHRLAASILESSVAAPLTPRLAAELVQAFNALAERADAVAEEIGVHVDGAKAFGGDVVDLDGRRER
jgi:hypothetical protein